MIADVARRFAMLSRHQRLQWAAMAPLGILAAALEAAGGALVFALLTFIVEPRQGTRSHLVVVVWRVLAYLGRPNDGNTVLTLAVCAAVVHVGRNVLLVVLAWWRTRVVAFDTARMSTRLLSAYMGAPWPFHLRRGSAGLIEAVRDSARPFFEVFGASAIVLTESAVVLGLCSVLIAVAPAPVTLSAAVMAGSVAVALRVTRDAQRRGGARQFEIGTALYRTLQHSLGALKELRILGRSRFFVDAFSDEALESARLETRRGVLDAIPRLLLETIFMAGLVALIVVQGRYDRAAIVPLASLYAYAGFRLVPAAHRIAQQISTIRWTLSASEPLTADLRHLEAVRSGPVPPAGRVTFSERIDAAGVSFTYEGSRTPVLRDVSLSVARGESVAIVGATGAGKTTLVDILVGLLAPSAGAVSVDGAPIAGRTSAWQAGIGYVPQAPFLLDDTLRRNIALGVADECIDEKALARAVSIARLDTLLAGLPQGLDTMIGERGVRLSGGERQRVVIARALYPDPALVIFDEATSALDPATEREIAEAVDALRGARTIIVIAHRLTTVERCDRILLLSEGRITASGSYWELATGNEPFRRLAALS
jgi:ATP-binding cassette subfamily C protein